ncbi:protein VERNALIZATION insensitive 3 [Arabidopsis lyrata subsp. lyrata]|uniref:Protein VERNALIZATION insensitive 3 n=2 Tax=Arabidopsis lyrata subsp. lyrata TaxID=81972 RepID=D7MN96_ARALL|nr:protein VERNALIZATION INSENSITIVE 3 isoform X1 [Arabidopsis lyrata subsp. lyrata]EFH42461.1 protein VERNALIZATION insensitive 3 [Arabidopsis lyrata subsp. lyrata]|eukprot:XP_002866202.1 protein VERNALIZATION INSENSITIVE 3 isoform X1 [Arabidopsis lyrata subsp. lyrata]
MQAASLSKTWRFDGNVGPENMDSSPFQDNECIETCKPNVLNVSERRELIHALSNQPQEASELLNSWSRNEIMKIICAEMGKERKYTGLNKPKLIENLLNLVSRPLGETSYSDRRNSRKKQKKMIGYIICCENLACRAALGSDDTFCRRCSCCICQKFDDNKDPSLWLTCEACGSSCHLECGLKQDRYGIGSDDLDCRFYCAYCGKDNDLLGCWRKQVKVAKETRRVDILCYRLSLGQKLLRGTRKYRNLLELMDEAVKKLEGDVGPLSGWAMKMARGIVNRLSSGSQVQKLCSQAMEALDKVVSPSESVSGQVDKMTVIVEEIQARSVTVRLESEVPSSSTQNQITGFRVFCRKSKDEECSSEVNCVAYLPETRSTIQGLEPDTEFCLRVVSFNKEGDLDESELQFSTLKDNIDEARDRQSPLTNSSSGLCSNPSLHEDESNNVHKSCSEENGNKDNTEHCSAGEVESKLEEERLVKRKANKIDGRDLLVTPCKRDISKGKQGGNKRFKSRTISVNEKPEINNAANGVGDKDLGQIVKTIRCLEQEGHIDKSFRERFLTWYSLRATHREVRVVKIFVETFVEDLPSLGEQLVDTFSECIVSKRSSTSGVVPAGICLKLWH